MISKELFKRDISDIEIGVSVIHLYSEDEFENAQIGYRKNKNGEEITDWIGDNYYVIGHDSCCGDPIVVDASDKNYPVYSLFHDDWSALDKITNSFKDYQEILKTIDNTTLKTEDDADALVSKIAKIAPKEGYDYWEALILSAYEFLSDND